MNKVKIFTIILIVFLLILMWLIVIGYAYRIQYSDLKFTYDKHQNMYNLIEHIHKLFIDNSIEYSIACGTALGQARNESIIPWDDDMDSYILSKDAKNIENLLKNDPLLEYNTSNFGYQVSFKSKRSQGYLDMFILYDKGDKLYYEGHIDKSNEWLYKTEWDLEIANFGGKDVYRIKKYKEYLDRAFGKNWKVMGRIAPAHGKSKKVAELMIDTNWSKLYTNYFKGNKLYK